MLMVCSVAYYAGVATMEGSAASLMYMHKHIPEMYANLPRLPTSHDLLPSTSDDLASFVSEIENSASDGVASLESNATEKRTEGLKFVSNHVENGEVLDTDRMDGLNAQRMVALALLRDTVWQFLMAVKEETTTALKKDIGNSQIDLLPENEPTSRTLHCTCHQRKALLNNDPFHVSDVPTSYIGKCVGPVNFHGCLKRIGKMNYDERQSTSCEGFCGQAVLDMDSKGRVYKPFHDLPVAYGTKPYTVFG
jgi:hypothetical protein